MIRGISFAFLVLLSACAASPTEPTIAISAPVVPDRMIRERHRDVLPLTRPTLNPAVLDKLDAAEQQLRELRDRLPKTADDRDEPRKGR